MGVDQKVTEVAGVITKKSYRGEYYGGMCDSIKATQANATEASHATRSSSSRRTDTIRVDITSCH